MAKHNTNFLRMYKKTEYLLLFSLPVAQKVEQSDKTIYQI